MLKTVILLAVTSAALGSAVAYGGVGPRDKYTDGANTMGPRDPYGDGARVMDRRDVFSDGACTESGVTR
ncbi:hypothetical protein UB46_37105 [Burkholderiaceae bacterium 16]|nr:hypothetical protein UB46_37105 [Burkholderiaceae bacterium 16]